MSALTTKLGPTRNSATQPFISPHVDFRRSPALIYWELTQACALACRHCRAEAMSCAGPDELAPDECHAVLRQIREFRSEAGGPLPHLILTGGDPLRRSNLFELIDEARALGIAVSVTPSVTPELTREVLVRLKQHGITSLGLSLDGSNAERHEGIRGVPGCFDWTLRTLQDAEQLGIPVQINTLVCEQTADDLPAIFDLLSGVKLMRWALFFLVTVGRGRGLQEVAPERAEQLMHWIYSIADRAPFAVKTTEAPHYRRVAIERMRAAGLGGAEIRGNQALTGFGIRDGQGIVFISHKGDVYPSGFLPVSAGNVRGSSLVEIYRNSALFKSLREPDRFYGKCGHCEYRNVCGGSRARAFAYTGNPTETDPLCAYQPKAKAEHRTPVATLTEHQ